MCLQLEVIKLVPKPPYRVDMYDVLNVRGAYDLPDFPLDGFYIVDEQGDLDLGPAVWQSSRARLAAGRDRTDHSEKIAGNLAKSRWLRFNWRGPAARSSLRAFIWSSPAGSSI